jgi:phage-related protein
MDGGLQAEPFASSRSIREQRIKGNDRPYFMGIDREPLDFTVSFAFQDSWDNERIGEVAKWLLSPRYYAPMIFAGDMDRIFYCLCVDSPELIHNCLREGYIQLRFRCADAFTYTPVYEEIVDLSNNSIDGTTYTFNNLGHEVCKPEVSIYKITNGDVSIANLSDGNAEMKLLGLLDRETVTIDCDNRTVTSDISLTNRYGSLRGDYLALPVHHNHLRIKGKCVVKFKYQLKRIQ